MTKKNLKKLLITTLITFSAVGLLVLGGNLAMTPSLLPAISGVVIVFATIIGWLYGLRKLFLS